MPKHKSLPLLTLRKVGDLVKFFRQIALGVFLFVPTVVFAQNPIDWVRDALIAKERSLPSGTAEVAAINGTLARIRNLSLPETGRVIVVNIASGVVTAYEDGYPVIESKAVVGKKSTPTPELDNEVTFVRPNPTWTVPQSILKRNGWRDKLRNNPSFFENEGFDVIVNGKTISPAQASRQGDEVTSFVQRPGPHNALGSVKIGMSNHQAIYMHDTNDPGKFENAVRAASAGCVRIMRVREIAAWILNVSSDELDKMIENGDVEYHKPVKPVRVILGYWTAWPDAENHIRFYPDIYGKDGADASQSVSADPPQRPSGDAPQWTQDQIDATRPEYQDGPRFVPAENTRPEPIYNEQNAR